MNKASKILNILENEEDEDMEPGTGSALFKRLDKLHNNLYQAEQMLKNTISYTKQHDPKGDEVKELEKIHNALLDVIEDKLGDFMMHLDMSMKQGNK